jgi:hypothetical protein
MRRVAYWSEHIRIKNLLGNKVWLIIPGITVRNIRGSFRYPYERLPPFTLDMFLPFRTAGQKLAKETQVGKISDDSFYQGV